MAIALRSLAESLAPLTSLRTASRPTVCPFPQTQAPFACLLAACEGGRDESVAGGAAAARACYFLIMAISTFQYW